MTTASGDDDDWGTNWDSDSATYADFVRGLMEALNNQQQGDQIERRRSSPIEEDKHDEPPPVDLSKHPLCDPEPYSRPHPRQPKSRRMDFRRFVDSTHPPKIRCCTALTIHSLGNSQDIAILPNNKIVVARTGEDKVSLISPCPSNKCT